VREALVVARNVEEESRPRLGREVVAVGPFDALPVAVVDDEERLVGEVRLDEAEPRELLLVRVAGVVVVDADAPAPERVATQTLREVALEDLRPPGEAEARQVRLELLAAPVAEREVVDRDRLRIVLAQRRDEARAAIRPDLDVALPLRQEARREIQQRQVVLAREPGDHLEDVVE